MHNRMPSRRRRPGPAREPGRQGNTAASQEGSQQGQTPRVGQAAAEDIERGVIDAVKGPVLDQVYDKVREGTGDPTKKLSP